MVYQIAEKFKSVQGEGLYAGTPMAFVRFQGCSVGKRICHHCDTDFDAAMPWRGGGEFTEDELNAWSSSHKHVCCTGGEPLDVDLMPLAMKIARRGGMIHIETSGTKPAPMWPIPAFGKDATWICVSPKPGYKQEMIEVADEIKVIVPGLGNGPGWPTLQDALRWADSGKLVYVQPRNLKNEIDGMNLRYVQDLLVDHPNLRLSLQLHKLLKVQ